MKIDGKEFRFLDHQPPTPFGCTETWGPYLEFGSVSGGIHICREKRVHRGKHICACGDEQARKRGQTP